MSTFTDTKPAGGVQHLIALVTVALVSTLISFAGFQFLVNYRAVSNATHHIAELRETTLTKLKADEKKKLPKGAKPDEKALEKAAEERLEHDAKVKAEFEKKSEEAKHHAESGLFPLACFVAIVSALVGGLFGAILLVKRTKDAALGAWPAFLAHIPSFAFYAFLPFLPILAHLAHHEHVAVTELIKHNVPVLIAAVLAVIGLVVNLIVVAFPSRPQAGDHHHGHGHDHDHGDECCGHSH